MQNQLKALKLGKVIKKNNKSEAPPPTSQRSKGEKETNDGSETARVNLDGAGGKTPDNL